MRFRRDAEGRPSALPPRPQAVERVRRRCAPRATKLASRPDLSPALDSVHGRPPAPEGEAIAAAPRNPYPPAARGRRSRLPYGVLAGSLALFAAVVWLVAHTARERDRARFENAVQSTSDRVRGRFDTHLAMLRGAAGLFDASGAVSRDEFRAYARRVEAPGRFPGVQGLGYARRADAAGRAAAVAEARGAGHAAFRVWPEPAAAAEAFPIVYLEPDEARNRAALGFDMYSEPVRRAAMERARDTGRAAMTGRVTLKQEIDAAPQPGFLIYLPVYRGGRIPASVEERRAELMGFVYAPFRAVDLFAGIFGTEREPRVAFRVYDGPRTSPEALLYDSRHGHPRTRRPAFTRAARMEVAGRELALVYESLPGFEAGMGARRVPGLAAAGLLVSLLLFAASRAQAQARSHAELRAEALRVALAERERLVSIVESSGDFIGYADPEGRVLYLNAAGRRMVGLEGPGEAREKQMRDFHTPEDAERLWREVIPVVRSAGRWEGEFRMRHFGTGEAVPIHLNLFTIPDPRTGEMVGLGTVTRDITGQKRAREELEAARAAAERAAAEARDLAARLKAQALELERQVEQARALNDELHRANRAKSAFLATMSHELRTPLNAVLGYADLLLAGIPAEIPPPAARQVERIVLASRHLLSVIEEILSHARIEAGRETVESAEVDLAEVLGEAAAIVEPLAAEKGLRFVPPSPDAHLPASIVTDARKLRQILVNLLGNAVKFTAKGEIRFEVEAEGGWVSFRVRDTGIGIAPADLERIFEPFRQVDEAATRTAGGTGLGLSVSRHLARLLGGDVDVESVVGEGSAFTLRLPVRPPEPAAPARPPTPTDFSAVRPARKAS